VSMGYPRLSHFDWPLCHTRMSWLWLLPDAVLPVIVGALGLLVVGRVLSSGRAIAILVGLVLMPVVIDILVWIAFEVLPIWLLIAAVLVGVLIALRHVAELLLGRHAAGHVIGHFVVRALIGLGRLFLLPFRIAGWLFIRLSQ
jgi:hypothetical protein